MNFHRIALTAIAVLLSQLLAVTGALAANPLADLDKLVRQLRDSESKLAQDREATFRAELQKQEQLAQQTLARRNAAEARGNELDKAYNANKVHLDEMQVLLKQHEGNLGELFGVTRQIAGDAANVLQQSMLTVHYPAEKGGKDRAKFLVDMAGAKSLPSIVELERMWFELQREMIETGKVVRFKAPVLIPDGTAEEGKEQKFTSEEMDVVRVGPFTAVSDGKYLDYWPSKKSLVMLNRQLGGEFESAAEKLQGATGTGYQQAVVDPSRGALLKRYVERPNFFERIKNGEVVGYVIVAVGLLGVLVALIQFIYLFVTRSAMKSQLAKLSTPDSGNPLGRLVLAFRGDKPAVNAEVAELRLSEAVLREVPKLERFQSFLRLAVAAGPLLGLVGTVIGMILTFHAITASGSSDPRLMAHGIGQAMIATVLGLGIAIPLLFINSGLSKLSTGLTQILDEHSQALLANYLGEHKGHS
jgi:biopolymer transport protein ExbB